MKHDNISINIWMKRVVFSKKIAYIPDKHNIYYFRAEKAMMLLMLRSNYKILCKLSPKHINIFYEVLSREVLADDSSRVDMNIVFKLI